MSLGINSVSEAVTLVFTKSVAGDSKTDHIVVTKPKRFQCPDCRHSFTRKENLRYHVNRFHHPNPDVMSRCSTRRRMLCLDCNKNFYSLNKLTTHLRTAHMIIFDETKHSFNSYQEFYQWKTDIEIQTKNGYSQTCGPSISKNGKTIYYHCNRSGKERKDRMAKTRRAKATIKIDRYCTSFIKLHEERFSGQLEATYCATHYGHEMTHSLIRTQMVKIPSMSAENISQTNSEEQHQPSVSVSEPEHSEIAGPSGSNIKRLPVRTGLRSSSRIFNNRFSTINAKSRRDVAAAYVARRANKHVPTESDVRSELQKLLNAIEKSGSLYGV